MEVVNPKALEIEDIFDMTNYYDFIRFNGVEFVTVDTEKIIYRPDIVELGQLFEIGRVIKDSNINFIKYKTRR